MLSLETKHGEAIFSFYAPQQTSKKNLIMLQLLSFFKSALKNLQAQVKSVTVRILHCTVISSILFNPLKSFLCLSLYIVFFFTLPFVFF